MIAVLIIPKTVSSSGLSWMAENTVEGNKAPHNPLREESSAHHAHDDGYDDSGKKTYL